jgi:hypothetical protein
LRVYEHRKTVRAALGGHKPLAIWLQELFIPAEKDFIHGMFQAPHKPFI